MELNALTAISSIDGRYRNKTEILARYFSEFGLIKYRVHVEIEYFIALCELGIHPISDFPKEKHGFLRSIYTSFNENDAQWIKECEKTTNHDVKAVEYFIKHKLTEAGLTTHLEFIHFGLTSQDINNTSIPLSLKDALNEVIFPGVEQLIQQLNQLAKEWRDIPMLARTHGQPASPTRLGKEIYVFSERLQI